MTLLFRSYTGSILHGLSTPASDIDIFEVHSESFGSAYANKQEVQKIEGKYDVTKVTLSRFMQRSMEGSHQCLDAMFSSIAEVDEISALRNNFRAGFNTVETMRRSITEMAYQAPAKKRRHAVRVTLNLIQIMDHGRYEPKLNEAELEITNRISRFSTDQFLTALQELAPIDLNLAKEYK